MVAFGKFLEKIEPTEEIHIAYPVGCLLDIPTATFVKGEKGNWHMCGGYCDIDSVVGPGNLWKTEQILYPPMTMFSHIEGSAILLYDTENSMSYDRLQTRYGDWEGLEDFSFAAEQYKGDEARFILTNGAKIEGDVIFEVIKEVGKERQKDTKRQLKTTPMLKVNGENATAFKPWAVCIDSLSGFQTTAVNDKIIDNNAIGESGANTVFMKDGAAKTQLMMQLPNLPARQGVFMSMTAHVGTVIEMDQYAPKPVRLTHQKNGTKHKGVPEKFSFYNTHLKDVYNGTPLINPTDKLAWYPGDDVDREKDNLGGKATDLMVITTVNSRNKNGPSGVTMPIIVSQREGILPRLTEFHYCKKVGGDFGIVGNKQTFAMQFYPDVKISRTTVRRKLKEDRRLGVACKLTADLLQLRLVRNLSSDLWCDPETLYNDIAAMGYDWNVLLDSRYWWVFKDDEKSQEYNELTIYDLLFMRKGEYHPYWLEDDKVTIKKEWRLSGYTTQEDASVKSIAKLS